MNAYFDVNDIPMFLIMLSVVWIVYAMIMKRIKSAYDTYVYDTYPKEPVMELELHQQVIEQPTVAPVAVKKKRAPRKKKVVVES